MGVAALVDEVDSMATWLATAHMACYEAKAAGRGTVRVAGTMAERPVLCLVTAGSDKAE